MATGSLTKHWSYPKSTIANLDFQQSKEEASTNSQQPSTTNGSSSTSNYIQKSTRREKLLAQPKVLPDTDNQLLIERIGWLTVPDFTDPDTIRPDEVEGHNLSKAQLSHLNKLYELQYKRDLDAWFSDGGTFGTALNDINQVTPLLMDGRNEMMEEVIDRLYRKLINTNFGEAKLL